MTKLISSQIDQLQEIGAYLRQVRQEQGIEIEQIANQIFIRPTLLRSLEAGTDDHLPEPVFVQGFIRRYGDALGLDGQALAERFSVTPVAVLPTPQEIQANSPHGVVDPETRSGIKVLAKAEDVEPRRSSSGSFPWVLAGSVGAIVIMLFLLVWGLTSRREQPVVEDLTPPETSQLEAEPPEDSPAEAPETALTTETAPEAPVVAAVNLTDRAWISVEVDGSTVFEGILEEGTAETWTAQNSIVLTSGNAGGVELAVNGGEATPMGAAGTVQTVTLTPETDSQARSEVTSE